MRGEALHLESFIWLALASIGWRVERAMGIENIAREPKLI
jgi:hypothetical protein